MIDHVIYYFVFGSIGTAIEVLFTGLADYRRNKDKRLPGRSYAWMILIFGLMYPVFLLIWPIVEDVNIIFRGLIYTALIYAVEYATGYTLKKITGSCPWEEKYNAHTNRHVHGIIRWDFAPLWFLFSIILERLFLFILY